MVTQEDGSASNQQQQLDRRRSLTAAAIRRGEVKISEPIPWEERGYIPPPPTASQRRLQHAASESRTQVFTVKHTSGEALPIEDRSTDEGEQIRQSFESAPRSPPLRHKRASLSMREDSQVQGHTTPVNQMKRESGITESPASRGSQVQGKKKRRSGSGTIRGVFKRLFSKRDKESPSRFANGKHSASPKSYQHGYHRSDPLPKTTEREQSDQSLERKNSPPQRALAVPSGDEYSSTTPVPQRLPFPMNVNAPQPESPGEHYTSFNGPYVHRRRATLPSVIVSPQDASTLQKYWATPDGLRVSPPEQTTSLRTPSPKIGMALSAGTNPNRRSRSAGALRERALESEQAESRRRSAEIQYWRQSYFGPDPDVVALEQQPSIKESSEHMSEQASLISEHHSGTDISAALADNGSSIRDEPAIQSITTYDFATSLPPSREKTQSPLPAVGPVEVPQQGNDHNQRISQLEQHIQSLTTSIRDLTGRAHRQTVILESAPRRSRDRMERLSHSHSEPGMHQHRETRASQGQPVDKAEQQPARVSPRRYQQPSPPSSGASTASVHKTARVSPDEAKYLFSPSTGPSARGSGRPVAYQAAGHFLSPESVNFDDGSYTQYASNRNTIVPPSLPSPSIYTHLAPLYSALRYERSQRKDMEVKISHLTEAVSELTAIISSMRVSEDRQMTWKQKSRFSGYDDSDNDGGAEALARGSEDQIQHRAQQGHSEGGNGDEDITPMVTPMEEWTTPTQEWAPRTSSSAELGSPIEGEMF